MSRSNGIFCTHQALHAFACSILLHTTMPNLQVKDASGKPLLSTDMEALLRMLRRGLLLSLESMDSGVFEMKLNSILDSAGEYADLVLMSGLDLEGRTALHIAVETRFEDAVSHRLNVPFYLDRIMLFKM